MTTEILTSPIGNVTFSALTKPRQNSFSGRMEYSARIEIDSNTVGAAEFLKTIRTINRNLGSQENVSKEGNYFLNAKTIVAPKVLDKDNNVLTEDQIPMIDSGTVQLILKPFASKNTKMGGGLSLVGVKLIDIKEFTGASDVDESALVKALNNI